MQSVGERGLCKGALDYYPPGLVRAQGRETPWSSYPILFFSWSLMGHILHSSDAARTLAAGLREPWNGQLKAARSQQGWDTILWTIVYVLKSTLWCCVFSTVELRSPRIEREEERVAPFSITLNDLLEEFSSLSLSC